ncbi:hypothetical protein K488DRAFT_77200 [Vararia minispora EC-137]|uniref:Uncharacterized protein n=1 Tax=Vararia minispora EC-137 TaxID=1314806 RepID=A0ACB8QRH6_9AGAM|nr:hypothetical protein K488DRAFT_77200 [Vararia minispora EC-137]
MWGGCNAQFASLNDLVGHVNLIHLRPVTFPQDRSPVPVADSSLSCRWDNCNNYPSMQSIPGSSSSTSLEAAIGVLSEHLFHDHLGVQVPPYPPQSAPIGNSISSPPEVAPSLTSASSTASIGTPESASVSEETENAACRWRGCGLAFGSTEELTLHITTAHVGAGKAHYECYWDGCLRNGDKGFSSKQKICRHLQSHTGHRPFQCKLCKQNFSEAATLQQHMRRHTQEKPYVCDVPGCGKAFAIAGALTIHKRTHNGDKPFKCTYCGRAFSESSNLSKHLRTHTGVRPYACTAQGCGKTFSRPDQLTRHASVHKK